MEQIIRGNESKYVCVFKGPGLLSVESKRTVRRHVRGSRDRGMERDGDRGRERDRDRGRERETETGRGTGTDAGSMKA